MGDASGPAGTPAGVSLPADALARAFPFHIVCDEALVVRQCGVSLRKLLPDMGPGVSLGEAFTVFRPEAPLSRELLESLEEALVLIEHRATRVRMRGEFVRTGEPGHWAFLGSPWFASQQDFEATSLTLDDFAPHDSAVDMLLIGQTRQIAINDLQRLTGRLGRQREELRRTEAMYRAAFAAAGGIAYQEDLVHDRFTYAGDGFRELAGCEPGELRPSQLRRSETATGSPNIEDDTTWIRAGDGQIRRRIEYPFTTVAGDIRWISDSSVLVADDTGRPVSTIGMLTDITSRKRAEQRLRESEEEAQRLALVAAKTNNIVMLFDASRRIEWVNEGFTRLVGYSLAEVRGGLARDFLRTDVPDPRRHQEALAALERGEPFLGDILGQRRDGSPLWLKVDIRPTRDAQGGVIGFLGIGTDITDLKTYERRLAQLRDELDAVLRVIPGGIVAFDADGRVAYCNTAFERIVGLSRDKLFGMSYPTLDRVLAGLCNPGEPPGRFADLSDEGSDQIQIVRPSTATIVRSVRATAGDESRRPWRVFYLRDVTRQVEQERMKDEFLSMAAHELRTPMSSVHGFAELLMSRDFDAATSRSIAATIHRQSSLLVEMVNDLLDLARIESGQGQDFELAVQPLVPIARETVAGLIVPGDTRRVAIVEADREPPAVSVDPARLRQALTNVLSNAYKYSRGRGAIRMSFPVRTRLGVRWAGILVEDEGIGMTPEQLRRVFDRFYRADRSGAVAGTGLGMPLAKEIMERMNGLIEVTSEAGKGTKVTLWLPVHET